MGEGAPVRAQLWGPGRRGTTVGLILLVSVIAFEAMGVGTAMPALVADLGAVESYAWPFVTFMAAGVVGTVLGGRWCDVAGPRVPLVAAPTLFGVGLLVAGTAGSMPQLLAGRVLQGLGAGCLAVAVYVLIAIVYPERSRPAVFGLMSSAWVLPSLVGPPVAAVVTERLSWHVVFLGLVPLVLLAVGLVLPAVRRLAPAAPGAPPARRGLMPAAFAAAAGVTALSWAGQHVTLPALGLAAGALVVLVPSLRRLLPAGVFVARRGIPAVVACRGLLAGAFFTADAYLPLMTTATHGWSLTAAGMPLLVASLGWSVASAWQGRHPDLSRPVLVRIGFALVAAGVAGLLVVAPTWGIAWLALPLGAVTGTGMGLGSASLSALLLSGTTAGDTGFHASAAQVSDQLTTAVMIGFGGALLVVAPPPVALTVLVAVLTALALVGVALAGRTAGSVRVA